VSEERASGDGFRRTVTQPLLQGQLVAVAARAAGGVGRLVAGDGALRRVRARKGAALPSLATAHVRRASLWRNALNRGPMDA